MDTCAPNTVSTDLGCLPTDPVQLVEKFYGIGLSMIGGLAILFLIYGGYIVLSSQGDHEALDKGKSYIKYAVIGILFAILGYVFVQVVLVDILHVPGFSA